jgi:cysteine synthase
MARFENILGAVGITADAALTCALEESKSAAPGSTILAMSPDADERYLSPTSNRMAPKPAA